MSNGEDNVKHCADCGREFTADSELFTIAIEGPDPPSPAQQIAPLLQYHIVCEECFRTLVNMIEHPIDEESEDNDYRISYNF